MMTLRSEGMARLPWRHLILDAIQRVASSTVSRVLIIHSSLVDLRPPTGVEKWDFLWALRQLIKQGDTLVLPAFFFSFCRGKTFSSCESPSESGILADWALELPEFKRTGHPIYSFAVAGPQAASLAACRNSTSFGEDSIFAAFDSMNARIIMLGSAWAYCTHFHRAEELESVPYRYFKEFDGFADVGAGASPISARFFVRHLDVGAENDFRPLIAALSSDCAIESVSLWSGRVEAADCRRITLAARSMLARDPYALVRNGSTVEWRTKSKRIAMTADPLRVALLGSANLALLQEALSAQLAQHVLDRRCQVHTPEYGQLFQDLLNPSSDVASFNPDFTIFPDRLEDLLGCHSLTGIACDIALERVTHYCDAIAAFRRRAQGWFVIHMFPKPAESALGAAENIEADGPYGLTRRANELLAERLGSLPNVRLVNIEQIAHRGIPLCDDRLWFAGRFPYSGPFSAALAHRYVGLLLAAFGRTARLLVLDLDNTLWGGILGEDGLSGIHVGGDYPGNAFAAFQLALKKLAGTGVALALCSKNDESEAIRAIDTLPGMVLRSGDFVATRIGWDSKWASVAGICDELNLGLDSVMFVDDNPAERDQMRQSLPQVKVLELPQDPADYVRALLSSPWLARLELTKEDTGRTESYRARAKVADLRRSANSLDQFYASLAPKLYCQPLGEGNLARALQLLQKTNQFNATARRHNAQVLTGMVENGADVVVLGLEDKFSAKESVGLIILDWSVGEAGWPEIDTYLLSCRVLGRGIEVGALGWLAERAWKRGAQGIVGRVIETERNAPVRTVFAEAAFSLGAYPNEWRLDLRLPPAPPPSWLTIVDHFEEAAV